MWFNTKVNCQGLRKKTHCLLNKYFINVESNNYYEDNDDQRPSNLINVQVNHP